jgi:hypothetical protein
MKSIKALRYVGMLLTFFGLFLLTGTPPVFAQQKKAQNHINASDKNSGAKNWNLAEKIGWFQRWSSTENIIDKGNEIKAVRRINLIVETIDSNGKASKQKVSRVELELYSKIAPPVTDSGHFVRIGDAEFAPFNRACSIDSHCIIVEISPEQFEALSDNALISYRIGNSISPKILKESYKGGEPSEIIGAKFGRLNKKAIDEFPTLEQNFVQQK